MNTAVKLIAFVVLDLLWLGVVAMPVYLKGMGHLMSDEPKVLVAVLFYLVFALDLMVFVVMPRLRHL